MAIYIYQYAKVVLNGNYFFLFTLFAFDALQFIFVVNVFQSVLFYFLGWIYFRGPQRAVKRVCVCVSPLE